MGAKLNMDAESDYNDMSSQNRCLIKEAHWLWKLKHIQNKKILGNENDGDPTTDDYKEARDALINRRASLNLFLTDVPLPPLKSEEYTMTEVMQVDFSKPYENRIFDTLSGKGY